MQLDRLLSTLTGRLRQANIDSARLDSLLLLEDATTKDRSWLLAHPEYEVSASTVDELYNKCIQRAQHIPLAYIRGRSEFYGRTYYVDEHVLEPRPETETVISLLAGLPSLSDRSVIVDVGTGSGALAITAALELPQAAVYGTDIDPACLVVAARNSATLGATVNWLQADLIDSPQLTGPIDAILTNLPYVPDDFHINLAASHEPRLAIFGGPDGLDVYRRLAEQLHGRQHGSRPRFVLCESLPPQHKTLAEIFAGCRYTQLAEQDFIQVFEA